MRLPLVLILLTTAAMAAEKPRAPAPRAQPAGPKKLGMFEDWTAATHTEAGQTICYAFTRAQSSAPALRGRGEVVLTVTQRGGARDAVAFSAGFAYPAGATLTAVADQTPVAVYAAQRSAFARDGKAAVGAFQRARQIVLKSPSGKGSVTDAFSLRGFSAAYAATLKACSR